MLMLIKYNTIESLLTYIKKRTDRYREQNGQIQIAELTDTWGRRDRYKEQT